MADDRIVASPGPRRSARHAAHLRRQARDASRASISPTPGWLTSLNRDPRLRVPAGFGTRVVQTHQEDYVARAWAQVTQILAMNRRLKLRPLRHGGGADGSTPRSSPSVSATTLADRREAGDEEGQGIADDHPSAGRREPRRERAARLRDAAAPAGRGVDRPAAAAADPGFNQDRLVEDINEGKVTAAPPKDIPDGLPSDEDVASGAGSPHARLDRLRSSAISGGC